MKKLLSAALLFALSWNAVADPQLTAWLTNYSGQYARVYTTTARRTSGTSSTTWTNQSVVAYADVAQILYSANWVYVRYPDLPSHVIGPWLNPQGAVGTLWPANQKNIAKFPRSPSFPTKKTSTGTGYSGNWVNGVAAFNPLDGKAWNGSALVNSPHTRYTNYWHQNAPVGEDYNFDYALGHQTPSGVYHTHQNPIGLRYQLGDHVTINSSSKLYSEDTSTNYTHSPILGFAYDGYPIYGPYGYGTATNSGSAVRRMISGYVKRDGSNGTDTLSTNLGVVPLWTARYRTNHFFANGETTLTTTVGTNRPSVNSTYPLGNFAEDSAYLGDLTNAATGQKYVKGADFDLDEYNTRYCVTPEYPSGTYAYFVTIDSSGTPTYPYVFGFEFFGNANGTNDTTIAEAVTTNFLGGSDFALTQSTPTVNTSNYLVTLTWSSTEGGTYTVESSTDNATWTTQRTNIAAAAGVASTTNYTSSVSNGTAYVRLTRTALATNDSPGGQSGVVGQTNVTSFSLGNAAPVVANAIANQSATYGASFSFTFATNVFTDADSGQTLTYTASSSALTNTGIGFNAATRTFSATTIDATNGGTIATSYSVSVVATDNGSPAKSATNAFTLTINKAAASVTANNFTRGYGSTNPIFTGSTSGFLAADSITANFSSTATTNTGSPGSLAITPTLTDPGARIGNYTVTTNNGTLTITNAILTVTAASFSRGYGMTNPTFTASYAGYLNGSTFASTTTGSPTLTCAATTNSGVGSYTISNSIGSLIVDNYTFAFVNGSLTVTQAALTVTMNSTNRTYGAANPAFTGSLTGLINNDAITVTGTTTATTNSSIGTNLITAVFTDAGGKLGNYSVTTNNGTLTITAASLFVAADVFIRSYGSAIPTFTGTLLGAVNGDVFTENFSCTATTNSPVGSYPITPSVSDPGSKLGNYSPTYVNGALTLVPATLLVSADAQARSYGATNPTLTASYSGFVNGQTFATSGATGAPTLTTSATTNSTVGSYVITNAVGSLTSSNYLITLTNGALTVTQASLTVTANNFSRAYGVTNPIFTGTIAGLQNNDAITASFSTTATTTSAVGTYPIAITLADPSSKLGNYSVTTNSGTLTVTNGSGTNNYTVAVSTTNSLVNLALAGTQNFTFTDTASGAAMTVAVTMTAYSSSNASPTFTPIDLFDSLGRYAHLAVDSGLGGGDGNFVRPFEGANFSATLVSASSGLATNSLKFGIAGIGFRFNPVITWNSSAGSNSVTAASETLFALDANPVSLVGTNYAATLRTANDFQFSDAVDGTNYGLVLSASFFVGTNYLTITANPANASVCSGGNASFTASATNALAVQWQVSTNSGSSFANLANATNATLTFTTAATDSGNQYRAVFTGASGSATSTAAALTLIALPSAPNIAALAAASQKSTNTASALTSASGYAWSITNGTILSGSNTATVTFVAGVVGSVKLTLTVNNASGCTASSSTNFPIVGVAGAYVSAAAYVSCDTGVIEKFDTNGTASVFGYGDGHVYATAFDTNGNLYATVNSGKILKFTTNGTPSVFASGLTPGLPFGLAFDTAGRLYVALSSNVLQFAADGSTRTVFATGFTNATAIAFDSQTNLFVASSVDNRILKIPSTGGTNTVFAAATNIWGLAFDASGALFVADNNTNVIWKYATNGSRTSFSTDHVVAPGFLAFDTDGRLYSANYFTNTLYRYATNGTATLIGTNNLTTPEGVSVWPLPSWLIPGTAVATPTLAAPSYAGGQFSFTVSGTTGANYVVQATTNLTTWFTVTTNTAPFTYTETNAAIYLQRFYRAATP
ncbi:MAG: hypothetical protein RLZZ350_2294 [Verrucomicrobiota bacterium]